MHRRLDGPILRAIPCFSKLVSRVSGSPCRGRRGAASWRLVSFHTGGPGRRAGPDRSALAAQAREDASRDQAPGAKENQRRRLGDRGYGAHEVASMRERPFLPIGPPARLGFGHRPLALVAGSLEPGGLIRLAPPNRVLPLRAAEDVHLRRRLRPRGGAPQDEAETRCNQCDLQGVFLYGVLHAVSKSSGSPSAHGFSRNRRSAIRWVHMPLRPRPRFARRRSTHAHGARVRDREEAGRRLAALGRRPDRARLPGLHRDAGLDDEVDRVRLG